MKKLVLAFILTTTLLLALVFISEDLAVSDALDVNPQDLIRDSFIEEGPLQEVEIDKVNFESFQINLDPIKKTYEVSLISVGDIMAHDLNLNAARTEEGYDFSPQFQYVSDKIQSKDFAIGNFETVMAGQDKRYSGRNMIFNSPDSLGQAIKDAGFDIMTTANNHALDRGYYGIKRTLDVFDTLGVMATGTNRNEEESQEILTFEKENISFALLSYSFSTNGWPMPEEHPHALNMMEEEKILKDIERARNLEVDFVMVAVHWGLEYHLEENHHQRDLAEKMMYVGADIILGTHPHVIQPFEHVEMVDISGDKKDKFIIYSQGNFVSGQRTYPRAIGMYINFNFKQEALNAAYVDSVSVMPTYVKSENQDLAILSTGDRDILLENQVINQSLYQDLMTYEDTFISHIASRVTLTPYLNDDGEFIIYKK